MGSSWIALRIALLCFFEALVIVFATRVYVAGNYGWVAATEVAFITQFFYQRNLAFDDERSRSWFIGYPAYVIGSVAGALAGLYISKLWRIL